jgi:hypothetical protein
VAISHDPSAETEFAIASPGVVHKLSDMPDKTLEERADELELIHNELRRRLAGSGHT